MTFNRLSAALLAPKRASLAMAIGLAAAVLPLASHAATVGWGTAQAVSNNTDIQSTGVTGLVGVNFGPTSGTTTTVNNGVVDVAFQHMTYTTGPTLIGGGITVSLSGYNFHNSASAPATVTGNYRTVMTRHMGAFSNGPTITLSGLTIGAEYQIQAFLCGGDTATNYISGSPALAVGGGNSAASTAGFGKWIMGTFIADATSQTLTQTANSGEPVINALTIGLKPGGSGTITATGSLTSFTTTVGTASAAQSSVSVSGSGLTADITATAPSGFQVSSDDSTYANTATFTQSGGNVASTPLYVRLSAAAAVGSYSGNVVLSSAGASSSVNVPAIGDVYPIAGDGTWILDGNGTWSTNANWLSNQIADAVGGTANFTTVFGGNRNVTLDSNHTLGILNLSVTGGSLNILSSGAVLTLDNTGSTAAQINMTTAQNMALGTLPIELNDSLVINQNISNGTGRDLALGTISSTNGSLTIEHNSTFADGQTRFDGMISNGSGSIAFTQTNGRSIFNAANIYSGATTLNGGTLKLGALGALDNATSVSIAAGATFDLTVPTSSFPATYTWNTTSLSASGAATAATISGTAGGTIDMGAAPIFLTTNGTNPSLTVTGANLALGGNQLTVVTGAPLGNGVYTLVSADSPISGTVNSTALYSGSGLAGGASGVVSISGNNVILTVTGGASVSVTGSLVAFTTDAGTASAAQTVSVSGSNLATNDIIATAPAGFEVSSNGTTYADTATFTQSGGNVASTTLYVRLSAAASAGSYADNVTVTSTGANLVNVAASGTVYPLPGDGTWTLDGNSTWSTYANWSGNVIADGVGKSGTFTLALASPNKTITLDSNRTLGVWNLGQTGRALNFAISGGSVLTLDNTGSTNAQINVANGGKNIAAAGMPIELMDSLNIVSVLPSGTSLTLGTITVKSGASNSGNLTITNSSVVDNTNPTTVFGGAISNGTGTIALVNTAGTSSLNAANTYTGATTISGGTLKLGTAGSLANATTVSIAAGATLDLTVKTNAATYTWSAASLSASGTATTATISGTAGGTIDMGIKPISLTTNGTHPSLTVTGAALALGGNQFTVVVPGTALGAGVYTLVTAASITGTVNSTALYGGSGLLGGTTGVVSISGGNTVILTVTTGATYSGWASANGVAGQADVDSDNDGVSNGIEYFMNILSSDPVFTPSPALNGSHTITWTNGGSLPPSAYGTQYVVQTSNNLADWLDVPSGNLTTNTAGPGGSLTYTLTGAAPRFVRLKVTPN